MGELQTKPGLIVVDEIQKEPSLFTVLRPLLDEKNREASYLLLGSASPALVKGVSESLAGRAGFLDLTPFLASEVRRDPATLRRLWLRGGFPRSFLARTDDTSFEWREAYLQAVLERDVPALRPGLPVVTITRLMTMLAHSHGGVVNESELASGLGVSSPTVGRYVDILEGLFLVRRLAPCLPNLRKRLTKAPRIYLRDSGLLHALLGLRSRDALLSHPKVGASWEGFLIEQILGALRLSGASPRAFYWRTHGGAEIDLVVENGPRKAAIELKLGAPSVSRGFHEGLKDLGCPGFVFHGGSEAFKMGPSIRALPTALVSDARELLRTLFP